MGVIKTALCAGAATAETQFRTSMAPAKNTSSSDVLKMSDGRNEINTKRKKNKLVVRMCFPLKDRTVTAYGVRPSAAMQQ